MTDELIGKQFNGYEIIDRVGKGGMATVYLAMQTSMGRKVAVKVLPRDMVKDDSFQRFEREVTIVARLEHRNIVPVYDHGSIDGQPYIVMRYMNAGSIDELLRDGALPPDRYLDIMLQVAPALDYAHTKNVIHRDLKPSNILMDDDGGAYITDFGIARLFGDENHSATITTQGVVGTPSYMSPEQAQGHPLDGRSDVYSLGVMLFEMATGRRPFQSDTPYSIAVMQVTTPPPSPRLINPKVGTAVEQVIYKALKKKPDERYQTATELAEALKMALERPDFVAHETHKPMRKPTPQNLSATQPHTASPSPQPMVIQQPVQQSPIQQPMYGTYPAQPMQPQPIPPATSLYHPPTPPPGSTGVRSTGLRSRINKKRGGGMWVSILIGALIGCALLTAVVVGAGLVVNQFINSGNTTSIDASNGSDGADGADDARRMTTDDTTPDALQYNADSGLSSDSNLGDSNLGSRRATPTVTLTPNP